MFKIFLKRFKFKKCFIMQLIKILPGENVQRKKKAYKRKKEKIIEKIKNFKLKIKNQKIESTCLQSERSNVVTISEQEVSLDLNL